MKLKNKDIGSKFQSKKDSEGAYTFHIPGVCPECGNIDITYGSVEPEDDCICYPAECAKGHSFNEWYEMTFIESVSK